MSPQVPESAAVFWRCGKCGTPNPRAAYLTRCLGCGRAIPPAEGPVRASSAPTTGQSKSRRPAQPQGGARARWVGYVAVYYGAFVLMARTILHTAGLSWWVV